MFIFASGNRHAPDLKLTTPLGASNLKRLFAHHVSVCQAVDRASSICE